jgi:hypothetical protein
MQGVEALLTRVKKSFVDGLSVVVEGRIQSNRGFVIHVLHAETRLLNIKASANVTKTPKCIEAV